MTNWNKAATEWKGFWTLPVAAALGYSSSVLHIYSLGPFIAPLQHEFHWSRAQISFGITIQSIVAALLCIPIGMLVDRAGPRVLGLIGALLMCATVALLGTATGQTANWLLLWGIVGIGAMGVQATVWTSAVASRFEASRGLAFAITLCGASISATVLPIVAAWLIGSYGWRAAFAGMAGIWAALVLPMLLLFFRGAQDQGGRQRVATPQPARVLAGVSVAAGLRSPALYKLLLAASFFSFALIAAVVHFVPILTDRGATPLAAAGIASLIGIFSIVGRLGTGLLLDRFPGHLVGATAYMIPIIACTLLLTSGANPFSQAVAAAIFGLTVGSEVDVIAYLAAKHFGLKNFGVLYGALVMALGLGTAFGPLAAGAVFDHFGSYTPFLILTMAMMAAGGLALATLSHPAKSAQ